ncbi:MAG: DNA methyltransferase [Spirochaetaceae bacterium]|nr:DNA methyltransferase [Spirochaetaceae bacterium]
MDRHPGESTRDHPAPYPVALADRLIRMFSFVGDTVLDPFNGTATTQVAAAACGRNSIGIEVDPVYFEDGLDRLRRETGGLLSTAHVSTGEVGARSGLPSWAWHRSMQQPEGGLSASPVR